MKLLIYMPALNEEENIQKVIAYLPKDLEGISSIQYLVIDDGSIDKTAELATASGAQVITHGKNRGVGGAFHSAVQFALQCGADILVGIDADGQFNPGEILPLIKPILLNKADMVIGNRFTCGMPANMPLLKYWGNKKVVEIISSVSGQNFMDVSCGFRAYNREALLHLNIFGQFTYTHETILSLIFQGLRVAEYPIWVRYDPMRKSRVANSILKYALQTSKIILRVMLDYRPMRVFGTMGSIITFLGILCEVFLLGHYVLFRSFSPYKTVGFMGLGFIVFGMLVLIIALIADMLNRLRMNQDRILYQLRKTRYG